MPALQCLHTHHIPTFVLDLCSCPYLHCLSLSLWQPELFIYLFVCLVGFVTEVPVALQPLPLLLVQQEAVDVGEQLFGRHRHDEALAVLPQLVQQQHAEVGSGDAERLSAARNTQEPDD